MLSAVVHNVTDHLLQQVAELSILEMNILPVCCLERLSTELLIIGCFYTTLKERPLCCARCVLS